MHNIIIFNPMYATKKTYSLQGYIKSQENLK